MVANNTVIGFYEDISAGSASIIADNIIRNTVHKAIRCNGDHMSIKGNQIINADYGITASRPEVSYLTIMDNHLQHCQKYAISLASSRNLIKDNIIANFKVAINLTKDAEHNKIFNNTGTDNDVNLKKGHTSNTFTDNF